MCKSILLVLVVTIGRQHLTVSKHLIHYPVQRSACNTFPSNQGFVLERKFWENVIYHNADLGIFLSAIFYNTMAPYTLWRGKQNSETVAKRLRLRYRLSVQVPKEVGIYNAHPKELLAMDNCG